MNDAPTADDLILAIRDDVRRLARRFPSRGVDRDDLLSEADLALVQAARRFLRDRPAPADAWPHWAADRVRDHLRRYVRSQIFAFLADVPRELQRRAIKVHRATEALKARAIFRPTYEQIAAEARLDLAVVVRMSAFNAVIVRQASLEWCEITPSSKRESDPAQPSAWPAFGAKAFSTLTRCDDIHPGRRDPETGQRDGKIPRGDLAVCMVCYRFGQEGHRALRRSKATDPAPEPRPTKVPVAMPPLNPMKRQERRQLLFAAQ